MLSNRVTILRTNSDKIVRRGSPITLTLKPWDTEIPFRASFFDCSGDESGTLTHLHIDAPPDTNGEKDAVEFWTRVLVYYQGAVRLTIRDGQMPDSRRPSVRRSEILGLIGLAFPQKYSAGEDRQVSGKTVAEGTRIDRETQKHSTSKSYAPQYTIGHESLFTRGSGRGGVDADVFGIARAGLMPIFDHDPDCLTRYESFEREVFAKHDELEKEHRSRSNSIDLQVNGMYAYLSRIRKKADDQVRFNLRFLQDACDTAMMDMYQYVAGNLMRNGEVLRNLDNISVNYNQLAHAVQDRLGGIVPTLHPLWMLCLNSAAFVSLLIKYGSAPKSEANIRSIDLALSDAILKYTDLLELEVASPDNIVALDEPLVAGSSEQPSMHDTTPDEATITPSRAAETSDIFALFTQIAGADSDVAVALDVVRDGTSVKECAQKYQCSQGEVSKRKDRGIKKILRLLADNGITPDCLDLFGARRIARQTDFNP